MSTDIPSKISEYVNKFNWANFIFTILPSPFTKIKVVQVVMESTRCNDTKTARGTGATGSLESSIIRAFTECLQMYYSLNSTMHDEKSDMDIRYNWINGDTKKLMPNFFKPLEKYYVNNENYDVILKDLVASASSQGLNVFSFELGCLSNFSVSKAVVSKLAVSDLYYFSNNNRFEKFSDALSLKKRDISYKESLFM